MIKRLIPPDLVPVLRQNALAIGILVLAVIAFLTVSFMGLSVARSNFRGMTESPWVVGEDNLKQGYEAGARYDLSQKGVQIPPAREDRAGKAKGEDAAEGPQNYRRDCYQQGYTIEESDLCAQWANAAAMRFGNTIAAETYRLNYLVGFLTALGVFLAGIGVVLAGIASVSASRGVAMMAYGFMPALSFSVSHLRPNWIRLTVKNVGTGPATEVCVELEGTRIRLPQDRLGAGSHTTADQQVNGDIIAVKGVCLDLAKSKIFIERRFIKGGSSWDLAEDQPNHTQ